jgi:hypothetical protein
MAVTADRAEPNPTAETGRFNFRRGSRVAAPFWAVGLSTCAAAGLRRSRRHPSFALCRSTSAIPSPRETERLRDPQLTTSL